MSSERTDTEELEQLRSILVGPFEEHLRKRDEKILEVIGQMQNSAFDRISNLEEMVTSLSEELDAERNRAVTEIGDAMEQLGQQLRTFGTDAGSQTSKTSLVSESDDSEEPAIEEIMQDSEEAEEVGIFDHDHSNESDGGDEEDATFTDEEVDDEDEEELLAKIAG